MRKIFCLLLALLVALPFYPAQRKRVAVVLAGGGAKGTAHIGALIALKKKIGIGPDSIIINQFKQVSLWVSFIHSFWDVWQVSAQAS